MTDDRQSLGEDEGEQELLHSSQVFLTELERLGELETRKRDMSPDDRQRVPLAHEIEDVTVGLVSLSRYQTRLIKLEQELRGDGRAADRNPQVVLAEWRAAERGSTRPGR